MAIKKRKQNPLYYLTLTLTLSLTVFGLVMIASASSVVAYDAYRDSFHFLWRQLIFVGAGLVCMRVFAVVDYRRLRKLSILGMVASVIGLVAVIVTGKIVGGASRWLVVGGVNIQPSELAKLAVIIFTADILCRQRPKSDGLIDFAKVLGMPLLGIGALIMIQPDLGTALIIVGTVFAMLCLYGIRLRELFLAGVSGAGVTGLLILIEPYRFRRLLAFLDPWADPSNKGLQIIQALYAFGGGGISGVGLGLSRQKFGYLPAPYTDFILAIIGEELGLPGTLITVALFLLLALVIMAIVRQSKDQFGRLLAGGIGAMIIGQAILNMAGVTGLLPITGVPLPFLSYGGSSMVLTMSCIGILLNLSGKKQLRSGNYENNDLRRGHGGAHQSRARSGRSA